MEHRYRGWVALGAAYGLVAVAAAAAAAHLSPDAAAARAMGSAVQMNGWHALALVACGMGGRNRLAHAAGAAFAVGTLLFCGTVYAGQLGIRLGPLAPVGGTLLMLGWALLGVSALRR